jgi:hypothetical protein
MRWSSARHGGRVGCQVMEPNPSRHIGLKGDRVGELALLGHNGELGGLHTGRKRRELTGLVWKFGPWPI